MGRVILNDFEVNMDGRLYGVLATGLTIGFDFGATIETCGFRWLIALLESVLLALVLKRLVIRRTLGNLSRIGPRRLLNTTYSPFNERATKLARIPPQPSKFVGLKQILR